jgi:hypothetical protein
MCTLCWTNLCVPAKKLHSLMQIRRYINSARRAVAVWIDKTRLSHFAAIFGVGVLIFGIIYYGLTSFSQGLVNNNNPTAQITLGTAIYFSIVTISTLGYGDIIPRGFSKIFACIEVIFGLTMMGIIVAKLTSGRLSYHVRRLFRSDTQRRLEIFSSAFEIVQTEFTRLSPKIGTAFQETPTAPAPGERAECMTEFSKTLSEFHSRSLMFCRDIAYEVEQGDFFSDAPTDALQKTASSIEQSLFLLGQLIFSFPILARPMLLNTENRRRISEILECHRDLYGEINSHCENDQLRQIFVQIVERCRTMPENYYNIPEIAEDRRQPDQVAPAIDQPQPAQ